MKINHLAALASLGLGLIVSSALAADNDMKSSNDMKSDKDMKSDMSMTPKMAPSSSEMKDTKLYSLKCESPCDFEVQGHDKQEIIAIVLEHVRTHHNMTNATAKDVEAAIKVVEPKM